MSLSGSERAEAFRRGIDLFNREEFWEAHEAWELVWNATQGEGRLFHQGLIQAAASMVHRQKLNPAGMRALSLRALEKLARFDASHGGIDLKGFIADFERAVEGGAWPKIRWASNRRGEDATHPC